jgi:hypothetical protein
VTEIEARLRADVHIAEMAAGALRERVAVLEREPLIALQQWRARRINELDAERRRLLWMLGEGP